MTDWRLWKRKTPKIEITDQLREERMRFRKDLQICMVGNSPCYGSQNEYDACRLKKGDRIRYEKMDGATCDSSVKIVSFYDGPMLSMEDGTSVWPAKDLFEILE